MPINVSVMADKKRNTNEIIKYIFKNIFLSPYCKIKKLPDYADSFLSKSTYFSMTDTDYCKISICFVEIDDIRFT